MRHRYVNLATWILLGLVPRSEREPLAGDLAEEYSLRSKAASSSAADEWYLRQVRASVLPLLWARLRRPEWRATLGVALAAYVAAGIVELTVNWAMATSSATGSTAYNPLGLFVVFPLVVLVGYFAARFRPGAPAVLAGMMLLAATIISASTTESVPLWWRIAYFFVGPVAACLGGTLRRSVR
jgi:hypothetical protein